MASTFKSLAVAAALLLSCQVHLVIGGEPTPSRHSSSDDSSRASGQTAQRATQRPSIQSTRYPSETLKFSDDFDEFDLAVWQHELTLGGGGNWEFESAQRERERERQTDACTLTSRRAAVSRRLANAVPCCIHRYYSQLQCAR